MQSETNGKKREKREWPLFCFSGAVSFPLSLSFSPVFSRGALHSRSALHSDGYVERRALENGTDEEEASGEREEKKIG